MRRPAAAERIEERTPEPKQPKKAPVYWREKAPGPADHTELLLFALLLCAPGCVKAELLSWATSVLEQASVLKGPRSAWPAKLQSDMNCTFGSPGALVEPMALAIRRADPTVFAQAATAIKVLRLPGHRDDLEGDMLADYFRDPAKEKEPGSKKAGGAGASRWAGRALVDVAVLVKKSYRDLRQAMGGVLDEQPSVADELATYRAELAAATTECEWLRKSLKQAKNAHQMSAKRLKAKHCAVTEARQDERRKAQEALKVAKAALKVAAAEKLAAARAELAGGGAGVQQGVPRRPLRVRLRGAARRRQHGAREGEEGRGRDA